MSVRWFWVTNTMADLGGGGGGGGGWWVWLNPLFCLEFTLKAREMASPMFQILKFSSRSMSLERPSLSRLWRSQIQTLLCKILDLPQQYETGLPTIPTQGPHKGRGGLVHKVFFPRGPLIFLMNLPIPDDETLIKTWHVQSFQLCSFPPKFQNYPGDHGPGPN